MHVMLRLYYRKRKKKSVPPVLIPFPAPPPSSIPSRRCGERKEPHMDEDACHEFWFRLSKETNHRASVKWVGIIGCKGCALAKPITAIGI